LRAIYLILVLLGTLSAYGQEATKYLDKFSSDFNLQFAYDPDQIGSLAIPRNWSNIDNKEELKKALNLANIEIAEVESDRWLLRKKVTNPSASTYVRGQVSEDGNEALVSALIFTKDGEFSTLTDDVGAFILEISSDIECEICCQYLGYNVQCVPNDDFLSFELEPQTFLIDDVKISSKKIQVQITNLDDNEVMRIRKSALNKAALGSDVMRTVQMLSGVDASNDLSASLVVRASSSLQSLVTLDGIPLYNTETTFGMFSVLNPLVVSKFSLYKNTMPLEYGEFTGGYLACEGLGKIEDRLRLNIDINTLQSSAAIQVPIGKSTQVSGAFRRSNGRISNKQYYSQLQTKRKRDNLRPDLFELSESVQTSLENEFGDAYFNLAHEAKKDRYFNFSFFANFDKSGASYTGTDAFDRPNQTVEVAENYLQEKRKANIGLSLSYLKKYKSGSEFMALYYSSSYGLIDSIASDITFTNLNGERINRYDSRIRNNVRDSNLKFQYLTSSQKKWSYKAGMDLRILRTSFQFNANNVSPFGQQLRLPVITPYGGIQYNFEDKFIAKFGVRSAIVPIKNPVAFHSPRVSMRLKLNDCLTLKSSGSINQQFFRPVELERQLGQSTSANIVTTKNGIPALKSSQLTLGLQYGRSGFKMNGDIYTRQNEGILEQVLSMPGLSVGETEVFGNNSYDLFLGTNNVVGLDMTSSFEHGNYFGMLSYTFTRSMDRFPDLFRNRPLVDQNNRLHQLNLFNSYSINAWTFSTSYVFGSGIYTLDRAAIDKNVNRININPSKLFKQLPSYNRWDLSASYKVKTKVGDLHFDLGVLNLLDWKNVNSELYIYSLQGDNDETKLGAAEVELLGRIWSVGVRFGL